MYLVTTLEKDLYDQAKIQGKFASIISVSKLCTPEVRTKVEKSIYEMGLIVSKFDVTKDQTANIRGFEASLQTVCNLSYWLLHQISDCVAVSFLHEELSSFIAVAEQRMILLREK